MAVLCGAAVIRWVLGGHAPLLLLVPLPLVGAILGAFRARARRWSDAEVAAYLDVCWSLPESLLSWVHAPTDPALAATARTLFAEPRPLHAPRRWTPALVAASSVVLGTLALVLLAPPRHPPPPPAPGTERALVAPSLAALEGLRDLQARDDAERERRMALVAEAEKLDAELRKGMSRDAAQARLGALRDRLAEEHQNLGSAKAGSGLDAAARALEGRGAKALAEALANRDLVAFDEELERLASEREKSDRASAKRALEEAAAAARHAGAESIGKMLDQSAAAIEERAKRNDALRAFGEAMRAAGADDAPLEQAIEELDRKGSAEAAEAAADAMAKALGEMSDAEREQLAKNLAKMQKEGATPGAPGSAGGPIDPKALAEQLKQLAAGDVKIGEAERDRGMRDAERGLDQANGELRGALPSGQNGSPAGGKGPGQKGPPGGGPSQGGGPGDHQGATAPVEAGELRSRARARAGAGGAHVTVTGPGGLGQTPLRTPDQLGPAGRARELGNLDDGELPAEYRDQVRRYFSP